MNSVACHHSEPRRCNQCWKIKQWPEDFRNPRTGKVRQKNCADCIDSKPEPRRGLDPHAPLRVLVVNNSKNKKHAGIPSTISSASTCPPSCAFYGNGCYAEYHNLRVHWSKAPERGLEWQDFLVWVESLPRGQLWRHNDAGDLPGKGDRLAHKSLLELARANRFSGARGFTFSHKPLRSAEDRLIVRIANESGFTINLSANNLQHADELANLKIGPVAVVLPANTEPPLTLEKALLLGNAPRAQQVTALRSQLTIRTPAGRLVVICPAQTRDMTCADCQLCARPNRTPIVGFIAHGQSKARVSDLVQLKRKDRANG